MKVVCSGTVTAQIGLGQQKDRIATCLYFHHAAGRMMGAIFVTDCGNLLHDQSRIRQIMFLPEPRQLFITVAETRLPLYTTVSD